MSAQGTWTVVNAPAWATFIIFISSFFSPRMLRAVDLRKLKDIAFALCAAVATVIGAFAVGHMAGLERGNHAHWLLVSLGAVVFNTLWHLIRMIPSLRSRGQWEPTVAACMLHLCLGSAYSIWMCVRMC